MRKALLIILCAALMIGVLPLTGCSRFKQAIHDAVVTDAPETEAPTQLITPEPTDEGTPEQTAEPTAEPLSAVQIKNGSSAVLTDIRISEPASETETEPVAAKLAPGDSLDFEPDREDGSLYDISFSFDKLAVQFINVPLSRGDELVFGAEEADGVFCCLEKTNEEDAFYSSLAYPQDMSSEFASIVIGSHSLNRFVAGTDTLLLQTNWDSPELGDEYAARYAHLAEAIRGDFEEDLVAQLTESADCMESGLAEYYADDPEFFIPAVSNRRLYVRRADSRILSMLALTTYEDGEGGCYFESYNYLPLSGRKLTLSDVVADVSRLPQLIAEQLEYREEPFEPNYDGDPASFFKEEREAYAWTLDPTGLTVYFNGGAFEMNTVTVPYAGNEYAFNEEFLEIPSDNCMYIPEMLTTYMDLFESGEFSELRVGRIGPDENGVSDMISIEWNGTELDQPLESTAIYCWFVHSQGRSYLYVEAEDHFGCRTLSVFDLNGRRARLVETEQKYLPRGYINYMNPELWAYCGDYRGLMLDPAQFELMVRTDVITDVSGVAVHHVGADGLAEQDSPYADFRGFCNYNDYPLIAMTPIADIECAEIELNGIAQDPPKHIVYRLSEMPEGAEFYYVGTDNESFIVLLFMNSLVRVDIERAEDASILSNGVPIEELFIIDAPMG